MRKQIWAGVTVLLLVVSVATVAVLSSGGSTESETAAVTSNANSTVGAEGMRVYLDPETGEVGAQPDPSAVIELDDAMQNALRYDDEGLKTTHHADGSVSMNLEGRYHSASMVHVDENGKRVICTDSADHAKHVVNNEISTPATPEVK